MTNFTTSLRRFILCTTACGLFAVPAPALAQSLNAEGPAPFDAVPADAASPFGGVSITPTRVVLEGGKRSGQVTLYNSGAKAVTYRIETVDMMPLMEGGYAAPEDGASPVSWSAVPIMRYAPRQVTLKGGERQVVKILSRARRDTAPGEYRTHLRFSTIPLVEEVKENETETKDKSMSVSVGLEYRITIPLILRVGELDGGTEITSAKIENAGSGSNVVVELNRTGDKSDYAALRLLDAAGDEVGLLKGIAVLPPLEKRVVRVPVKEGSNAPAKIVLESNDKRAETKILSEYTLN